MVFFYYNKWECISPPKPNKKQYFRFLFYPVQIQKKHLFFIVALGFLVFGLIYVLTPVNWSNKQYVPYKNLDNSCLNCHHAQQGMIAAHQSINCTACHLGNAASEQKEMAHQGLELFPGNLNHVDQTCSSTNCHPGINHRINNSLMNTMSGIVNIDKYVFDEHQNLDSLFDIYHLGNSLADSHLRNKCASCHLGNEKTQFSPISELTRGGGCLACHLNYSDDAENDLNKYLDLDELPKFHPAVSLEVTDNHCFGCHSRSGRITTNYEGWHESLITDKLVVDKAKFRQLEDGRIFEKKEADIHHNIGLSCIDCHDTEDVMGDGQKHAHKEEAVTTSCTDCHYSDEVQTTAFEALDRSSQKMILSRGMPTDSEFVISPKYQKQLTNVILKNNKKYLVGKNNHQEYLLSTPTASCTNPNHQNVSCSTCHTAWAPQCISCHTALDPTKKGFDLLAKKTTAETWNEIGKHYFAEFPSLGVVVNDTSRTVKTFTPGMIMNLETPNTNSFVRLFAPTSAHTISAQGKTCKACHNNPVALGYGRGELTYDNTGSWNFTPQFEREKDSLPMDAWIGFLTNDTLNKSTRSNARPFNFEEQKKILAVGACLTCHQENSGVISLILQDYHQALNRVSSQCILPKIKQQ